MKIDEIKELFKQTNHIFQVLDNRVISHFAGGNHHAAEFKKKYTLFENVEASNFYLVTEDGSFISATNYAQTVLWNEHTPEQFERFCNLIRVRIYQEQKTLLEIDKRKL